MKYLTIIILLFLSTFSILAQVRIIEVNPINDEVTVKNFGGSDIDITNYRFCALLSYTSLASLTLESGNLILAAGAEVKVSGSVPVWTINDDASDLGLYLPTGFFSDKDVMQDFTQWGSSPNGRESVAVDKGIWSQGDFLDGGAPYTYTGDGSENGLTFWQTTANTETDFLAFTFGQMSAAIINTNLHTIDIEVEFGTNTMELVSTFTLSSGATSTINSAEQVSGASINDFTNPVEYTVTAEDENTTEIWTVTVTVALNTSTDITSFSFAEQTGEANINSGDKTIAIEVQAGTNLASLIATFSISDGATARINSIEQSSGVTVNDYSSPLTYNILAEDNVTSTNWTITVTLDPLTKITSYSFAEQTEAATISNENNTISIEVSAGTDVTALVATFSLSAGAAADINGTSQISGTTSNDFTNPVVYTITAGDGVTKQDWTISVTIDPQTNILSFSFSKQQSAATINLENHTVEITVVPGTDITSIIATFSLSAGASAKINGVAQESEVTSNNFSDPVTYVVTSQDGMLSVNWVVTVTLAPYTGTDFLSFSFQEQSNPASIDPDLHEIEIDVPFGTDLTSLVASFTLSPGATTSVVNIFQETGVSSNDYSGQVSYSVVAEDGISMQDWIVEVSLEKNSATEFLSFSFNSQLSPAVIDSENQTIDIEVNKEADITALVASFELSSGATAITNSISQESGVTANNFADPLIYCVVAEDGVNLTDWTITVFQEKVTGITEFVELIQVYPNPVVDIVTVNALDQIIKSIRLYDARGFEFPAILLGNEIDFTLIPSGNYIIIIEYNEGSFKKHLIKR